MRYRPVESRVCAGATPLPVGARVPREEHARSCKLSSPHSHPGRPLAPSAFECAADPAHSAKGIRRRARLPRAHSTWLRRAFRQPKNSPAGRETRRRRPCPPLPRAERCSGSWRLRSFDPPAGVPVDLSDQACTEILLRMRQHNPDLRGRMTEDVMRAGCPDQDPAVRPKSTLDVAAVRQHGGLQPLHHPCRSTKLSSTIFRPALSKSTVSLLPSTAATLPGPNFGWNTRPPTSNADGAPVDFATSSPSISRARPRPRELVLSPRAAPPA